MSTILDALRKSERARRARQSPVYGNASETHVPSLLHWGTIIAGLLLLAALVALVWLLQRQPPEVVVETPSTEISNSADNLKHDKKASISKPAVLPVVTPSTTPATATPAPLTKPPAPAMTATRKPEPKVTPPAVPNNTGQVTPWSSLPESERAGMPPLRVNIHVYTPDENQRILYIDNELRVRGEEVAPGVVVDEVVPEGAIVRYRGQRYLLPRPT